MTGTEPAPAGTWRAHHQPDDVECAPADTGIGYVVSGLVSGFIAFAPAAWLAWFMLGCWSESGTCEFTGTALVALLVAMVALLVPVVGGSVSASRGKSQALDIAGTVAFALVAVEWILVFA